MVVLFSWYRKVCAKLWFWYKWLFFIVVIVFGYGLVDVVILHQCEFLQQLRWVCRVY